MSKSIKPLLREDADEFERMLLGSAECEDPPPGARKRAMAALGLSAGLPGGHEGPATTSGGASSAVLGAKWVLLAAVVVAGGAAIAVSRSGDVAPGGAGESHASAQSQPVAPREDQAPSAPPTVEAAPDPATAETQAAPVVTPDALPDAPTRQEAATTGNRRVAEAPRDREVDDALARETALVDSARRALATGDPTRALRLLDEHRLEFRSGAFILDAEVLRIEALERAGRTAEAGRLAHEFLARHPEGSYARRVRTVRDRMANMAGAPTKDRQVKEPVQ